MQILQELGKVNAERIFPHMGKVHRAGSQNKPETRKYLFLKECEPLELLAAELFGILKGAIDY